MAKNISKIIQKDSLISLDFSANEATVYSCLVENGPSKAGVIISKTGLHRNIVYTAFDHLILRKIVTVETSKKGRVFSAISPDILIEEYNYKKELAEELSKNFKKAKSLGDQEISVHVGNEEYLKLLTNIISSLPKGSTKMVLGTGGADFMQYTMIPIWKKYHMAVIRQQVKIKMIAYESQKSSLSLTSEYSTVYNTKYLSDTDENPAGVHIYPEIDTVLNIIYSNADQEVTAIKIKNKSLTKGYLNLFKNLWEKAKK